jgi:hypothetical protein
MIAGFCEVFDEYLSRMAKKTFIKWIKTVEWASYIINIVPVENGFCDLLLFKYVILCVFFCTVPPQKEL